MKKFKLVSFSKELSKKFKLANWLILSPILFWPLIFFMSIFFFDDPNTNPIIAWLLFIGVNVYPIYLFILFEINARISKTYNVLGFVLPISVVGVLLFVFSNEYFSTKEFQNELRIEKQVRKDAGYLGNCDTYRINDNVVYYRDTIINGDPNTFQYLGCHYAKDKNDAFMQGIPIVDSDAKSFEIIDWLWQKDKNQFYYKGVAMKSIDYESFEILELTYSKDKNNVYFNTKIIKDAMPNTFKINFKDTDFELIEIGHVKQLHDFFKNNAR